MSDTFSSKLHRTVLCRLCRKGGVCICFFLCLLILVVPETALNVEAGSEEPGRRLIQTTTPEEEFAGRARLGLLRAVPDAGGNINAAAQNIMPAITRIQIGNYWGSGVIIEVREDSVIIASNKHLLEHGRTGRVDFYNGSTGQGKILGLSDDHDVGFMQADTVSWSLEQRMKLRSVSCDEAAVSAISRDDTVFQVGSSDGVAANVFIGDFISPRYYVPEFKSYMLYTDCKAKPGMSGGGVFDRFGHFQGMITGGNGSETVSVPVSVLWDCAQKAAVLMYE